MFDEKNEAERLFVEKYMNDLDGEVEQAEFLGMYLDKRDEFSKQYSIDLVRNYYLDNPSLGKNVINSVRSMFSVSDVSPMSVVVMAMTSVEVLTKNVLLKPFLMGMLHNGHLADFVTKQVLHQNGLDRFNTLLYWLLDEHIYEGIQKSSDLKMEDGKQTIWQARSELQKIRNDIMHKAEECTASDAEKAIELYMHFDILVSEMLASLKLTFSVDYNGVLNVEPAAYGWSTTIVEAMVNHDKTSQHIFNGPPMDFDDEIPW
ncbi:hypothetical protein D2H34_001957 [Vibrio fluvialis]|nr:hypothetical protein [Vibrio fluvialis]ELE5890697.1 hypothetical protein [Vibrio fluvialis]